MGDVGEELFLHPFQRALLAKVADQVDVPDDVLLRTNRSRCDSDRKTAVERAGGTGRVLLRERIHDSNEMPDRSEPRMIRATKRAACLDCRPRASPTLLRSSL